MRTRRRQRKILIISAVCQIAAALILCLAQVIAYFIIEGDAELSADYGLFQVREHVYFANGDTKLKDAVFNEEHQGYTVQVASNKQSEPDYITNLRIDIEYRGHADMYLRVCVIEMWVVKSSANDNKDGWEIVSRKPLLEYDYSEGRWAENRKNEHSFFYYKDVDGVQPGGDPYFIPGNINATGNTSDPWSKKEFLSYTNTLMEPETSVLFLGIMVQCVQPNRYRQLWNISQLP